MRLLYALFLFVFSTNLFAQPYFDIPATLTNRTDTEKNGTVRYYDWTNSPQTIEFKEAGTETFKTVPIRDVQRLNVIGKALYKGVYCRLPYYAEVPIQSTQELVQRVDSTYYLAEILLDSDPVILYRLFDSKGQARFLIAKNDSLVLLEDINVQLLKRNSVFNYTIPEYRKTLKRVLKECPTLNTETTMYTERGLIDLLKEYISFCRIEARIYSEQKNATKAITGLGAFYSTWANGDGRATAFGATVQLLFPKLFHNVFVLADIGAVQSNGPLINNSGAKIISNVALGIYGGRYFGRRAVQGKLYTGLSSVLGPLDTGVGISYRKLISAEFRYPVMYSLVGQLREEFSPKPLLNFRAIIPLNRQNHK